MMDLSEARRTMVDCQVRPSDVTRYAIIAAMLEVPREQFVPRSRRAVAYAEAEVEMAPGRLLMAPRVFAKMVESADIGTSDLVLDLCPGTGYSTAVFARMAQAVIAIEAEESLVSQAEAAFSGLDIDNALVSAGNPPEGDATHGPFDVIFINGTIERVPDALKNQLKQGGRLVAIVQNGSSSQCRRFTRSGDALSERYMFDATAPLLDGFQRAKDFMF